jgi:hypothetical protein
MPVETAADRAAFCSTEEFGEQATYTLAAGGSKVLAGGIFDRPHIAAAVHGDVETSDAEPTFWCPSAELPAGAAGGDVGDLLQIAANDVHGALSYRVVDLQPDGQGMTLITLGRSA